jgi:hypothetical protein
VRVGCMTASQNHWGRKDTPATKGCIPAPHVANPATGEAAAPIPSPDPSCRPRSGGMRSGTSCGSWYSEGRTFHVRLSASTSVTTPRPSGHGLGSVVMRRQAL